MRQTLLRRYILNKNKIAFLIMATALTVGCGNEAQNEMAKPSLRISQSGSTSSVTSSSELLMTAIHQGKLSDVNNQISIGADVNYVCFDNERPLVLAAKLGHFEIVSSLIRAGADFTLANDQKEYALNVAIENNYIEIANLLIRKHEFYNWSNSFLNSNGDSSLMLAVKLENLEISRKLLISDIDLGVINNDGETAHSIAINKNQETLAKQIETVIKITTKSLHKTLLQEIIAEGDLFILDYIFDLNNIGTVKDGANLISHAINIEDQLTRIGTIRYLLKKGLNANGEIHDTKLPLIEAVKNQDMYSLRLLGENGAEVNYEDPIGNTPLVYAVNDLNNEAVLFLIENGANTKYETRVNGEDKKQDVCDGLPRRPKRAIKAKVRSISRSLKC